MLVMKGARFIGVTAATSAAGILARTSFAYAIHAPGTVVFQGIPHP